MCVNHAKMPPVAPQPLEEESLCSLQCVVAVQTYHFSMFLFFMGNLSNDSF